MQKPWSLYNKEDKLRVDDLTTEHVRIILLATATSRMSHWYACQEGDIHWQPISAIPEFYEDVRQIKGVPEDEDRDREITLTPAAPLAHDPAPPVQKSVQRRPLFEDAPAELKTDPTLQIEKANIKERRTARRYPREITFRLKFDDKVFECKTLDISMSGLSLEQPLPEWAPKSFPAELEMNKTVVRVLCSKVSAQQMKIKESSSWDVIRAWIVNW